MSRRNRRTALKGYTVRRIYSRGKPFLCWNCLTLTLVRPIPKGGIVILLCPFSSVVGYQKNCLQLRNEKEKEEVLYTLSSANYGAFLFRSRGRLCHLMSGSVVLRLRVHWRLQLIFIKVGYQRLRATNP